jgi:hypothetical protein
MARGKSPISPLVNFDLRVTGDAEVAKLFGDIHSRVRARVKGAVDNLTEATKQAGEAELASLAKVGKGRLARGLVSSSRESPTSVSSLVFHKSRTFYILSYGSRKHETMVRAHTRHIERWDTKSARKFRRGRMLKRKVLSMGVAFVDAHPMKVNLAPRPFLSRAWQSIGGAARAEAVIGQAVALGTQEAKAGVTGVSHDADEGF